jgi:hypothetical protein
MVYTSINAFEVIVPQVVEGIQTNLEIGGMWLFHFPINGMEGP